MTAFFDRFRRRSTSRDRVGAPTVGGAPAALRIEVERERRVVAALRDRLAAERRTAAQLPLLVSQAAERARLAGMPAARLGSDALILEGPGRRRLEVARVAIGEAVDHPLRLRLGLVESATRDPVVQALWDSLQGDDSSIDGKAALRGAPNSVLDIPGAVVSLQDAGRTLRVTMQEVGGRGFGGDPDHDLVAVPKFTFDFAPRKLRNFGHWLLDCVPQVVALSAVDPSARFLLPSPLRGFQRATLGLVGVTPDQMVPWQGDPLTIGRLLVFESEGRAGGRPLSALLEMRHRLTERRTAATRPGTRRIYVSRRDAEPGRQWVANEPEIEAMFAARGFDVVVMAECPLDEQIRLFREARVVAGVSGAGLSDIVFCAPDTHVIVLLSDSLMTWYADDRGARSNWVRSGTTRPLSTLGDSPHFYVQLAAVFGQHCHCFLGSDEMPLARLSAFLDGVLQRMGES